MRRERQTLTSRGRIALLVIVVACLGSFYISLNHNLLLTRLNQIDWHVEQRLLWWDGKDTSEEVFCRGPHTQDTSKPPIPNIVHFVLLAPEGQEVELEYYQYLAIKSAILRMNASSIKVHTTGLRTSSHFWKELMPHVTLNLLDHNETTITFKPTGKPEMDLPHQSDILRISILSKEGGIYFDTDVFALTPFTDILENAPRDTLMGNEGGNRYGLCNAVIVSRPHSEFLQKWQQKYEDGSFDPKVWNYHSVRLPKQMQAQFSDLICPLSPKVFFWPTWAKEHVKNMHEPISTDEKAELEKDLTAFGGVMYQNQLAFHAVDAKEYLRKLTREKVLEEDTRFNILVRDVARASL